MLWMETRILKAESSPRLKTVEIIDHLPWDWYADACPCGLPPGECVVHPRRRFELPGGGFFHYMAAADYSGGHIAMKQYTYSRGKVRFLVPLYAMATGDLLAMIEADHMGQLRTGAATGPPDQR